MAILSCCKVSKGERSFSVPLMRVACLLLCLTMKEKVFIIL